jgi:hypothetical protein
MNDWKKDDRAAVTERPELVGTVTKTPRGGDVVEVALDGGGTGRFKAGDLTPEKDAPLTNKTWPPSGIETKIAT